MPDRRIRDSHNMLKLLLDVMQGIVFTNDYYALPRIQSVEYDTENPRVDLIIQPQCSHQRNKGLHISKNVIV
jgi:Holliday junction resolvase RusA-like endonuclease